MSKILFITESYLLNPSPNGICVQNVAEELIKRNEHVTVITLMNDVNQEEYSNYNGVDIYRVDPGYIRKALYTSTANNNLRAKKRILTVSSFNGLLNSYRYPYLSSAQVNNLFNKAKMLYSKSNFDYVVVVYHQIHPVLAGIKLKKLYPSLKLVLYTLDAISGGYVPRIAHSNWLPKRSLLNWENYIFKRVDKIFIMESHWKYYALKRYDSIRNKIERMDIPMLRLNNYHKNSSDGFTHLVFTGSMSKNTANPIYLIKLFKFLPSCCIVDIYGRISEDIKPLIEEMTNKNSRFIYHGVTEHKKILQIQANAEILLNFGNANPNMIPCKIFEYISTGNKIISFTHSSQDSSLPYIRKYKNAIIIDEDETQIEKNAEIISDFIKAPIAKSKREELEYIFKKNTPEYFVEKLLEI